MSLTSSRVGKLLMAVGISFLAGTTARTVFGDVITLSADQNLFAGVQYNQGHILLNTIPGPSRNTTGNVYVGVGPSDITNEHRSYFTFRLPSTGGPYTSATFMLGRGLGDSDQPDDVEQWGLFDVSTNAQLLNTSQNAQVLTDAFNDLGTGTSYGSYSVKTDVGDPIIAREVLSFPLNAAGLSAINASAGDYFSMGGKLLSITGNNDYSFGGGVPWAGVAKLVLTQVPEPSTMCLLTAGGALGVTLVRRRTVP